MKNLKKQLIRLGNTNPDLRKHLRPILDKISKKKWSLKTREEKLQVIKMVQSKLKRELNRLAGVLTVEEGPSLRGYMSPFQFHITSDDFKEIECFLQITKKQDRETLHLNLQTKDESGNLMGGGNDNISLRFLDPDQIVSQVLDKIAIQLKL